MPVTVGGGVKEERHVRDLLAAGADKVSINSAALRDPGLVDECAAAHGSQCIVVAIDAKRDGDGVARVRRRRPRPDRGRRGRRGPARRWRAAPASCS